MFVVAHLDVDVPTGAALDRVLHAWKHGNLEELSAASYTHGTRLVQQVGFGPFTKTVHLDLLPPTQHGDAVILGFAWTATGALGNAYPVLDANLEFRPGPEGTGTALTLTGSYRPSGGNAGALLDRAVLAHLADATITNFLAAVAELACSPSVATVTAVPDPVALPGESPA